MGDVIEVEFVSKGVRELMSAFDGIEAHMKRFAAGEAAAARNAGASAEAATRSWRTHASAMEKLAQQVERDQAKSSQAAARAEEKAAQQGQRAMEKAEQAKTRALEKETARREAIIRRSSEMAGRLAEQQANAEIRAAERATKAVAAHRDKWGRFMGTTVTRSVGNLANSGINLAGMALSLGGGFAIADASRGALQSEASAGALSRSARIAGTPLSAADALSRAKGVEIATHVKHSELLAGLTDYVKTSSDVKGGMDNLQGFAELSKATGTDFRQLMQFAARIKAGGGNMTSAQQMAVLRNVIGQGGQGSIEIEDLAKVGGKVVSTAGMYGGPIDRSQQRLLGLAQIPGKLYDANESATAVERLASDLTSNAGKIDRRLGVNVKDKSGMLRDPAEVIAELMKASGGDIGKLKSAGIGKEAMKIMEAVAPTFQGAGGGAAGAAAVQKQISQVENAGLDEAQVREMLADKMQETGEKLDAALEKVETALETELVPILGRLADHLPELLPKIEAIIDAGGKLAEWFTDNPIKGIGAIILGSVTKDLAGAAIGKAIEDAIRRQIGGGGLPTPGGTPAPGGAPGGAGIGAGGMTAIVAAGLAAIGTTSNAISQMDKGTKAGQVRGGVLRQMLENPDEAAAARREINEAGRRTNALGTASMILGSGMATSDYVYSTILSAMGKEGKGLSAGAFGGEDYSDRVRKFFEALEIHKEARHFTTAADDMASAAKRAADALNKVKPPPGGGGGGGHDDPGHPGRNGSETFTEQR